MVVLGVEYIEELSLKNQISEFCRLASSFNKVFNLTSTALLVLCFYATLAQNNPLRFGSLAERLGA